MLFAIPLPKVRGLGIWNVHSAQFGLYDGGRIEPWDLPSDVAEGGYFRFWDDAVATSSSGGPRSSDDSPRLT